MSCPKAKPPPPLLHSASNLHLGLAHLNTTTSPATAAWSDRMRMARRVFIFLPNVPSHRIPLAFGTTSCASKNRDESAEGTGFGGLARSAHFFAQTSLS